MKIREKLQEVASRTISGEIDAHEVAKEGIEAMFAGMQRPIGTPTPQWRKLMTRFAGNDRELARLCGEEDAFNRSRWGLACIAYIAGNSTCTSETAIAGGTVRAMSVEMLKNLDAEPGALAAFSDKSTENAFSLARKAQFSANESPEE